MTLHLLRHLHNMAEPAPCSRDSPGTELPISGCLRIARIHLSVNRDFFMASSSDQGTRKIRFLRPANP
jgi:hypothetical protein